MSGTSHDHDERARHLMMAALDGELAAGDRAEFDRRLDDDPRFRAEWERMNRVKEVTTEMSYRKPPEESWSLYWDSIYNRTERGLAWLLVAVGSVVLTGYGLWQFVRLIFTDSSEPLSVRMAIFAILFGGAILVLSVFREKWFAYRKDPYKEVER